MICEPCRSPHAAADCIDSIARREYPRRHCACQHRDRAKVWVVKPPVATTPAAADEDETTT